MGGRVLVILERRAALFNRDVEGRIFDSRTGSIAVRAVVQDIENRVFIGAIVDEIGNACAPAPVAIQRHIGADVRLGADLEVQVEAAAVDVVGALRE